MWLPVTWGELIPLVNGTLSGVVVWFRLSISEADEEGDSPINYETRMASQQFTSTHWTATIKVYGKAESPKSDKMFMQQKK